MNKLFGTDGIRGKANTYPMTCDLVLQAGKAIGVFVKEQGYKTIIIGKDTRISSDMLESAISAGIASTGVDVLLAGVIPTAGVAFLCTMSKNIGAGIVISASHNPYEDNGIKLFDNNGKKLSDEKENLVEKYIVQKQDIKQNHIGKIEILKDSLKIYSKFLLGLFPNFKPKKKIKIIIDCSNGAASKIVQQIFIDELFDAQFINNSPDGKNINKECGSQHTQELEKNVLIQKADLGFAFDGDADRVIAIDEKGEKITGDRVLAICAKFAKQKNKLKNNVVVSTVMSNIGLVKVLEELDIVNITAQVGDRRVLEKMYEHGAVIGGEDSGHMIFLDNHTTGDGILTSLKLLEVIMFTGKPLSKLAKIMKVYPQILMNVKTSSNKSDFMKIQEIADTIKLVEQKLNGKGRVLVRYSGTQPLLRVMIEGENQVLIEKYCNQICDSIRNNIDKA